MEKVLIIEDNDMMRMFLSNYLSKHYEVTTVETPKDAKAIIGSNDSNFSLVLADYQEAGSPQQAALESLQVTLKWQNVPMIILTDKHKSEQRIHALETGAQDCLSKPFNPMELTLRMKSLMNIRDERAIYKTVA